LSGRLMSISVP
jgi:hypothetical protein